MTVDSKFRRASESRTARSPRSAERVSAAPECAVDDATCAYGSFGTWLGLHSVPTSVLRHVRSRFQATGPRAHAPPSARCHALVAQRFRPRVRDGFASTQ